MSDEGDFREAFNIEFARSYLEHLDEAFMGERSSVSDEEAADFLLAVWGVPEEMRTYRPSPAP